MRQLPIFEGLPEGDFRSRPFLNSALVQATLPSQCLAGVRVVTTSTSTFDEQMEVWVFDSAATKVASGTFGFLADGRTVSKVLFDGPCESRSIFLFIHSDYWDDYRFRIASLEWIPAGDSKATLPATDAQR